MDIEETRDKKILENFLGKNPYLHFYEIGNLQEKLFCNTQWFVIKDNGEITAAALLYRAREINILYLLEDASPDAAKELLAAIASKLPEKMYSLLSPYLVDLMAEKFSFEKPISYDKMKLTGDIFIGRNIKYPEYTYRINSNDAEAVGEFLREINPGAFFNGGMLKTGKYFCIRKNASILATAGVHLYSKEYSVAAIGNVATQPDERDKGYATSVTASLCADLWHEVKIIGLNVKSDNAQAIKIYQNLGFVKHTQQMELTAVKK